MLIHRIIFDNKTLTDKLLQLPDSKANRLLRLLCAKDKLLVTRLFVNTWFDMTYGTPLEERLPILPKQLVRDIDDFWNTISRICKEITDV